MEHPVPGWVKLSFAIFDIRALPRSALSIRVPGCQKLQNYKCRFNQVWYRTLYSCTYMATVGIKGLAMLHISTSSISIYRQHLTHRGYNRRIVDSCMV